MKSLWLKIFSVFLSMTAGVIAEGVAGKFENLVLNEFGPENILKISVATNVFGDKDYFKLQRVIPLDGHQQNKFVASLENLKWHDSLSVASRADTDFVVIIETKGGSTYGLHASNGIESDCFQLVQVSLAGEPYVKNTYFLQIIKKLNGQLKPYNRVLRIPGWRTTEDGRKLLALVK